MLILILLALPLINAYDQIFIPCSGGNQVIVPCFGEEQISFFGIETVNPVINLIFPPDNSEDTDGIVDFSYNVSDSNPIENCSLYLDNQLEVTDKTITRNITQSFTVTNIKESDNIVWFVSCTDQFNNQANSSTRNLDTKLGEGTLPSGGGGRGEVPGLRFGIINISEILCNLTFESANKDTLKYEDIPEIQETYLNLTNQSVNLIDVRNYIDFWQEICAGTVLNLTLKQDFVCNEIFNFISNNDFKVDLNEINELKKIIDKNISIRTELLIFYVNNYNEVCYPEFSPKLQKIKPLTIAEERKLEPMIIYTIILVCFLVFFCVFIYIKRKKTLVFLVLIRKKLKLFMEKI